MLWSLTLALHPLVSFQKWQSELTEQEDIFQSLQSQVGRAKEAASRLSRLHPDRSPEMERYQERANQMAERWSGIKRQMEIRWAGEGEDERKECMVEDYYTFKLKCFDNMFWRWTCVPISLLFREMYNRTWNNSFSYLEKKHMCTFRIFISVYADNKIFCVSVFLQTNWARSSGLSPAAVQRRPFCSD